MNRGYLTDFQSVKQNRQAHLINFASVNVLVLAVPPAVFASPLTSLLESLGPDFDVVLFASRLILQRSTIVVAQSFILQLLGLDSLKLLEPDTIGFPYHDHSFWNSPQSGTWAF